ncbi:DUF5990 family protein [Brevundimonas faecalis]|uniref:Uncharacterized protein n=1 Tax=Brevundimonas faecalis TaxID=947378 RepID=A0ABV2R9L4_9CAUL
MARTDIRLRLTIQDPVPGVRYSLQGKEGEPVDAATASDAPLSFEAPVTLNDDGRLTGPFVRREGATRRFVYIAIGKHAGDPDSPWDRRAKIDIHDIPADLLQAARDGRPLELRLPGRGRDGSPVCATVRPLAPWAGI